MTDDEFLRSFEDCRLPKALWTHEAHVRMAWLYLRRRPIAEVIPLVRDAIRRYNASLGNHEGYHETITLAYLILVDDRIARGPVAPSFAAFAEANPALLDRKLSALLVHYSREALFAADAARGFVEPDLAPLPGDPGG